MSKSGGYSLVHKRLKIVSGEAYSVVCSLVIHVVNHRTWPYNHTGSSTNITMEGFLFVVRYELPWVISREMKVFLKVEREICKINLSLPIPPHLNESKLANLIYVTQKTKAPLWEPWNYRFM